MADAATDASAQGDLLLGNDLRCPMVTTDRRLRDEPGVDVVRT